MSRRRRRSGRRRRPRTAGPTGRGLHERRASGLCQRTGGDFSVSQIGGSMMTLLAAPQSRHGPVTPRCRVRRSAGRPIERADVMTRSTRARRRNQATRLEVLDVGGVRAERKATTAETRRRAAQERGAQGDHVGFTHTVAKWCSAASRQRRSISRASRRAEQRVIDQRGHARRCAAGACREPLGTASMTPCSRSDSSPRARNDTSIVTPGGARPP